jgi:hypothetical protein
MLAMAIFLDKYKKDISDDMKDKLESDWVQRWQGKLSNPSWKPRRVMKVYINLLDILVDTLDAEMCRQCWPDADKEASVDE